jgi:phenylalanyl-tRNA synthetase alpha subunit
VSFWPARRIEKFARANRVSAPTIQVSWGELVDRITILEIKEQRLQSKDAVANVRNELAALMSIAQNRVDERSELTALKNELKSVNEVLWEIEDKIRAKEASKSFDRDFIELARSVYINNDKRGALKRRINVLLNSSLGEQKQYTAYSK